MNDLLIVLTSVRMLKLLATSGTDFSKSDPLTEIGSFPSLRGFNYQVIDVVSFQPLWGVVNPKWEGQQ